jgi:hypothetical protein
MVDTIVNTCKIIVQLSWSYSRLYFFWILLHYTSAHAYIYFCAPQNFIGLLRSPFMVITPQCHAIDWVHVHSRNIVKNMWMTIGMWATTTLFSLLNPNK